MNTPENMSDIMRVQRPETADPNARPIATTPDPNGDPADMIRRATGLNLPINQLEQPAPAEGAMGVLTPEEAAQMFGNNPGQKIDVEVEANEERNRRADEKVHAPISDMADLLKDAIQGEEERDQRHAEALANETTRKEIFNGNDPSDQKKVQYNVPMAEQDNEQKYHEQQREIRVTEGVEDLLPAYDDAQEDAEPPEAVDKTPEEKRPKITDSEEEYSKYIKSLETVEVREEEGYSIVKTVRDRANVEPVSSGRIGNTSSLSNDAFVNAITKFKKDNFRTVSIPLVNSGFCVDIVGTGAVDLTLLYSTVDQNTLAIDYELEKMRTVMRNVVGTHPVVDKNNLRNMIHFVDYQLMAYAHISATLKDVEMIQTCTDCGKDFHIACNSADLILNMDELRDKMSQIKQSSSIYEHSLMATDRQMTTKGGFVVNMGHPSYAEYVQYLTELKKLTSELPAAHIARISQMTAILPYVRSVVLPNQVHTSNLYQKYMAMGLMTDADFKEVNVEIKKMSDQITIPKFGIKRVKCPHCGTVNTDIVYENLDDLLFFHIMVTRLLNGTDATS